MLLAFYPRSHELSRGWAGGGLPCRDIPLCSPPLLPVDAGPPPRTLLSHCFGTRHRLSHRLSFPASSSLEGTRTLPAPLCSPGQLQIPGPGIPASPSSHSSPPCRSRSAGSYLLLPGSRARRFPKPRVEPAPSTSSWLTGPLWGPCSWCLCQGKIKKPCSQRPSPSGTRE